MSTSNGKKQYDSFHCIQDDRRCKYPTIVFEQIFTSCSILSKTSVIISQKKFKIVTTVTEGY